jgi:cation diffusion facilitator CzcD-associated flavoprotein CzcO
MPVYDLIILGAGPYGLSAAAHCKAGGLQFRVFGKPMEFWRQNMPAGMFLRSSWEASHIAHPSNRLKLEAYSAASGKHVPNPIPLESFVNYGQWFQQQAAGQLDERKISNVEKKDGLFDVIVENGERLQSRAVVVAAGIGSFARRPESFAALPPALASHSSQHTRFDPFKGKRVLVVGGGQSALESGALLHEAGAHVKVLVRRPNVHWLRWRSRITRSGLFGRLIYSPRDVGPPGVSQLVARPNCLKLLPRTWRDWIDKRSIRPAGAGWLMKRMEEIPIRTEVHLSAATKENGHLRLSLSDGTEEIAEHVLFATGYRIDVSKYKFLSAQLLSRLELVNGYPRLRAGLESSVDGLYFLGAPAAWSFGPVARFVSGAYFCVPAVVNSVLRKQ